MLNARKLWEKPQNNANKPTQNKTRKVRRARHPPRSDPDTQQLAVEYACRQRPPPAPAAS
jgi:hypothetical protein